MDEKFIAWIEKHEGEILESALHLDERPIMWLMGQEGYKLCTASRNAHKVDGDEHYILSSCKEMNYVFPFLNIKI